MARFFLAQHQLRIKRFRGTLVFALEEIEKVQVSQRFLDRFLGVGNLHIQIKGRTHPIVIKWVRDPYAGWKQIKIALFQRSKTS